MTGGAPSDLARRVDERCRLTGTFALRSGDTSTTYFDKYLFEGDPEILRDVTQRMVPLVPEGAEIAGRRVLVVEDVITTGGQVVQSSEDLRERGAIVDDVLCVIGRSDGDHARLDAASLRVRSLFTLDDLGP